MAPWPCLYPLLFLCIAATSCGALQGRGDHSWGWHQTYIGRVKNAVFHSSIKGKKQVIVGTEQNVVASLNIHNGEIYWRQLLGASEKINGIDTASGKYVITLSGGSMLRAWSIADGNLVWETNFTAFRSPPILDVTPIEIHHLKAKMILVFGDTMLYGVSSATGEILWQTNTSNASQGGMFCLRKVLTGQDKNSLYGVGFTGNSGFSVWKIYLFTGRLIMQEAATVKENICTDELVVTKHTVVALDCAGKNIFTGHIGPTKSFSIHKTPVRDVVPDAFGKARLLKTALHGVFLLRFIDQIVLMRIGTSGHDLEILEMFERPAVISNAVKLPFNKTVMMLVQPVGSINDNKIAVRMIFKDDETDETLSHVLQLEYGRGMVQQVHLSGYVRTDESFGLRALLVMEDCSLMLMQKNEILWIREDGLATIQDVVAVDLPKELPAHHSLSLKAWFKGYIQRFLLLSKKRWHWTNNSKKSIKPRVPLIQDKYRFQKLLVVLTKAGKLLAVHTMSGQIMWSLFVPSLQKTSEQSKIIPIKIFQWCPLDLLQGNNPIILLIGMSAGPNASGILTWIDVYTGTEVQSHKIDNVGDMFLLTLETCEEDMLYLVFEDRKIMNVFLRPRKLLEDFQQKNGTNIDFPITNVKDGSASGYQIDGLISGHASNGMPFLKYFKLKRKWKVDFSKSSERILSSSTLKQAEVIPASCNGNCSSSRSSVAVMVVATASVLVSNVRKSGSSDSYKLTIHVLDVGSGRVLHRVQHVNTQGLVHVINDGHWFVHNYFDRDAAQHKISIGIVNETPKSNSGNASSASPYLRAMDFKVLDAELDPYSLTTLALVKGLQSNSKRLLIGTSDGQILYSDITVHYQKKKGSNYSSNVVVKWREPSLPQHHLSPVDSVKGLREIVTIPTELSSRSLIFAYGIDLLFSHAIFSQTHHLSPVNCNTLWLLLITIMAVLASRLLVYRRRHNNIG